MITPCPSDSDSEDENLARLKESVDTELLNDGLFNGHISTINNNIMSAKKSSLRLQDTDEDNWIKTTPAFRNYVANILVKQLDAVLEKELVSFSSTITPKLIKNRVKLFKNSKKHIRIEESVPECIPIKRRLSPELDYDELENKCKLVAVSGLDILQKKETKAWSTRTKAPVDYYVKLKNGSLVEKCT